MKTNELFSSLLLLIALTAGCGSSDSGSSGTGGTGGIGATGGSGGTGGSPVDPGGPLLDRPSGAKYACSVSRPVARLALPWGGFSLVPSATGARFAAVLADRNNPDPNQPGNSINWSTLGLDGVQGSPTVVRAATRQYLAAVTAASDGEKSTIVWSEAAANGNSSSLNSLQVDASGAIVTPATALITLARSPAPQLARAGSGYALLWVDSNESSGKLTFGLLDESGKLASTPVVLAQGPYIGAGAIASVGDHFVVSYADYQYYESGLVGRLLVLDSNGSVLGQPIPLEHSGAPGFASTIPSLLTRGDQVLAAWSVASGDNSAEVQEGATTIRIARFDASGERQGPMYDLQAPVKDREAVEPFWVDMGDEVGLLWSAGSIIYVCAGCVPNHSLKFVVLDGQSFIPQSNVVELTNTFQSGGLLSPAAALTGENLLVVSSLTFHTSAEGASGTIQCVK
jgi:hypothetical protein